MTDTKIRDAQLAHINTEADRAVPIIVVMGPVSHVVRQRLETLGYVLAQCEADCDGVPQTTFRVTEKLQKPTRWWYDMAVHFCVFVVLFSAVKIFDGFVRSVLL
jgi:hypothetical protein